MTNRRRRRVRRVPRRIREPRKVEVERLRFAAGGRLVVDALKHLNFDAVLGREPSVPPIDIIRPLDLVFFTVKAYGIDLVEGENPILRPKDGARARLVIEFPFQHLAERALYEKVAEPPLEPHPTHPHERPPIPSPDTPDPAGARHEPPILARPAVGSRVVFEVPADDQIPFSIGGILDALGRLEMAVHPLAKARTFAIVPPDGPIFHLPGKLVASLGAHGLVVKRATAKDAVPDPTTVAGLAALARGSRLARSSLASTGGIAVGLGDPASGGERVSVRVGEKLHAVPRLIGPGALIRPDRVVRPAAKETFSRPAGRFETAINAPFRLTVSPSSKGGWGHAREPVVAPPFAEGEPERVELWHSRLGVRGQGADGITVNEQDTWQRIVRAVWARDREKFTNWQSVDIPSDETVFHPFRTSLDGSDRHMLVRQSAETWLDKNREGIHPLPVEVEALWLSSLGAWLDLHGEWDSIPYSESGKRSILSWDHVAPMGRDQFVRVVYPGYLYPFGHKATLVKITERKMKHATHSVAGLYQRMFIVVGEPIKHFDLVNLPFSSVRLAPLVTPNLEDPTGVEGDSRETYFWPKAGTEKFSFVLHTVDRDGRHVRLIAPLLWVAEHYGVMNDGTMDVDNANALQEFYEDDTASTVDAAGQSVTFAPVLRGGDTMAPTFELYLGGDAIPCTSIPKLRKAKVELPAVQQLSPIGPVTIEYHGPYVTHGGFGGPQNVADIWADVVDPPTPRLLFGENAAVGSDRAGGFLAPNLSISSLSRLKGTVGNLVPKDGGFDPEAFLSDAVPRLFGLINLVDILELFDADLSDMPNVVSEALDRIEAFLADLERATQLARDAVDDANRLVERAKDKAAEVRQQAADALQAARDLQTAVNGAVDAIVAQFTHLSSLPDVDVDAVTDALADPNDPNNPFGMLRTAIGRIQTAAASLPPLVRQQLLSLANVLQTVVDAADLIEDIARFLSGLSPSSLETTFRYEWRPRIKSWPEGAPVLTVKPDGLVLAVEGRASGKGEVGVEILAEFRDFSLTLLPGETLVRFKFDHLSFRAGSARKTEVDVVLQDIEFLGYLGFVETLKDLIPFDGFSDPPYLEVTPEGLTAGYTLALPSVAVGVFTLSNISLAADVRVPFLGGSVSVGFNFCTRERPFTLAVSFIGGGGWFLMRLTPEKLDVLELGLEAGASLSVDFGVASGSISAMLGIYLRLEGNGGSLAGYFRLRGEVDVLGLISASIELYLSLAYDFETGKMCGSAKLTIKVDLFLFSISVTIECERQFAGSNGDPNFVDVMELLPDGTSPAWSEYCLAFAGA